MPSCSRSRLRPARKERAAPRPSYPGNTIKVEQTGPVVAGDPVTVRLSGRADWGEPTDVSTISYDLYMYVQNADVDGNCEPSYGAQLQKAINIANLGASETLTDFVLDGEFAVNPQPPEPAIDWSVQSLPFVITPGIPNVLLCAYSRYVIDDAAYYQLPVRVEQPRCGLKKRKLERGKKLGIKCVHVSGRVAVELEGRRGKSFSSEATLSPKGIAKVATKRLKPGAYEVTMTTATLIFELGTVRIK